MTKNSFLPALAILITLTCLGSSVAQSRVNKGLDPDTRKMTFSSEPVSVETPTATLYGTLALPQSRSAVPVVLIVSGSGPTDRDGNSPVFNGPNNSLKMLAEGLAARGIASLRYDKRGIGESGKAMMAAAEKTKTVLREEDLSFETYIDDAVSWARQLGADRRFSSLIILGHSEGSLIGMVAAQRTRAAGYVSLAGAGRPVQQLLLEQLKVQLPPDLFKTSEDILGQLAAGKRVESVPPSLLLVFRPSVQPYMMSWLRYDPAKEIGKLHIPVLIVQGTTDVQASPSDPKALASANPAATLLLIDGMNHVLKTVPNEPDKQTASYGDPTLPVAPDLISGISDFVIKAKPSRASQ